MNSTRFEGDRTVKTNAQAVDEMTKAVSPAPACTITITPNQVPYGGSAMVSWGARNSDHVILQGEGEVAAAGSITVSDLTSTRTYALAVAGSGGTSSCYTVVNVGELVHVVPSCIISAHPDTVAAGRTVSLSWGTTDAKSAELEGQSVEPQGGTAVTPDKTTNYSLLVTSESGEQYTCDTTVTVQ